MSARSAIPTRQEKTLVVVIEGIPARAVVPMVSVAERRNRLVYWYIGMAEGEELSKSATSF